MSFMRTESYGRLWDVLPTLEPLKSLEDAHAENELGRVFVTSGNGVVGYRVAMSLLEAGHKHVRVGIYRKEESWKNECCGPQCAEALAAKGAEVVDFDWTREDQLDAALKDVQTVFCTIYRVEGWQDVFPKFVRKCMYKNVRHFVKVSFLHPTSRSNGNCDPHKCTNISQVAQLYRDRVPYCTFHGSVDDYLVTTTRQGGGSMTHTILACSHLMTNPLFLQGNLLRQEHKFVTASYGMGVNYVSPNDVADAAVVVILKRKEHSNKIYNLTGPAPIKDSEVVQLLNEIVYKGKPPIEHIQLGYHDYVEHTKSVRKLPIWQVKDSCEFERMKAMGFDELPFCYTKDLEHVTGKKPESFGEFLRNQTKCMRPGKSFP